MSYEILRRRAESFLRHAFDDFERGDYDLVLFHVEQAIQLYAKYLLYRKLGDFPKTCSIVSLLRDLSRIYESRELESFVNSRIELLYLLEESYITSRYIPREYDLEIAKRALELGKKLLEVFKWLEKTS
ncbi:MAG: HEPN domain-containing protein [Desulfurococcaceae archaeon]